MGFFQLFIIIKNNGFFKKIDKPIYYETKL